MYLLLTLQEGRINVDVRRQQRTFLKAKPSTAIFLPEMVLNMASMMRSTKRCFW